MGATVALAGTGVGGVFNLGKTNTVNHGLAVDARRHRDLQPAYHAVGRAARNPRALTALSQTRRSV
jgi:hypothetical protein